MQADDVRLVFADDGDDTGRQGVGADQPFRMGGQDGVAIQFRLDPHRRVKARGHGQTIGDGARLIHAIGPRPAYIQLLQADDVRLVFADDGDDTVDIETTVCADAAVNIVGEKAGHGGAMASGFDVGLGLLAPECDPDTTIHNRIR